MTAQQFSQSATLQQIQSFFLLHEQDWYLHKSIEKMAIMFFWSLIIWLNTNLCKRKFSILWINHLLLTILSMKSWRTQDVLMRVLRRFSYLTQTSWILTLKSIRDTFKAIYGQFQIKWLTLNLILLIWRKLFRRSILNPFQDSTKNFGFIPTWIRFEKRCKILPKFWRNLFTENKWSKILRFKKIPGITFFLTIPNIFFLW